MHGLVGVGVGAALLALVLSAAEWVNPEALAEPRSRRRVTAGDFGWFVVYVGYAPLTAAAVMALVAVVAAHGPGHVVVTHAPFWEQCAGAFAVADGCAYWLHRAMHSVPVLWRVHRVHHGATSVRWWTTFRFHPGDGVLAHAVPLTAAALCGFGPDALAVYLAFVFGVTLFAHADVWIPATGASRIIVLPRFHRAHHAVDHEHSNFALVLPVWDLVFGTASFGTAERQRRTASPIASEPTLATQLAASAPIAPARPPRHTRPASR